MSSRRVRKSNVLATQAVELAFTVPQVVAHRMMRIAFAGLSPSLHDRREFYLMGAEKFAAFYESWNAMALEAFTANITLSVSLLLLYFPPWSAARNPSRLASRHLRRTTLAVLAQGTAPFHRRVMANAGRLRRGR